MNTNRKKSILILTAALFFGVLLGLLVPAVVHKINERRQSASQEPYRDNLHRRNRFVSTVHRVIGPDSLQEQQIKPVTEWAAAQIDSIESSANRRVEMVFDSVVIRLRPVLTEEQLQRLDNFHDRARKNWHRHDRRRRH